MGELTIFRIEYLFVFSLLKHVSIKSIICYLVSHGDRKIFRNEILSGTDKSTHDENITMVEEIGSDTLFCDNPDTILYCGENGNNIVYNSVTDMNKDILIMRLSGVYP